jgi:hypothetical protein
MLGASVRATASSRLIKPHAPVMRTFIGFKEYIDNVANPRHGEQRNVS